MCKKIKARKIMIILVIIIILIIVSCLLIILNKKNLSSLSIDKTSEDKNDLEVNINFDDNQINTLDDDDKQEEVILDNNNLETNNILDTNDDNHSNNQNKIINNYNTNNNQTNNEIITPNQDEIIEDNISDNLEEQTIQSNDSNKNEIQETTSLYDSITKGRWEADADSDVLCLEKGKRIQYAELNDVMDWNELHEDEQKQAIINYSRCYPVIKDGVKHWYLHFFTTLGEEMDDELKNKYN